VVLAPLAICSCLFVFVCTSIPQDVQRPILAQEYQVVMARYNEFCRNALEENFSAAYQYTSLHYQQLHDQDQFKWDVGSLNYGSGFGEPRAKCPVPNITYVDITGNSASIFGNERTTFDLSYEGSQVDMVYLNGNWFVENIEFWKWWNY
jgi:hypothetical protein